MIHLLRKTPRRLYLACLCAGLGMAAAFTSAVAQDAPATQPTATAPSSQPTVPEETMAGEDTVDTVNNRIAQVQAATDLQEKVKAELLGVLGQTKDQLSLAASWATKREDYERRIANVPASLETAKQRLSVQTTRPATTVQIDVPPDATLDQLAQLQAAAEADLTAKEDIARKHTEEARQRTDRRSAVPDLLTAANQRSESKKGDLAVPAPADVDPQIAQARRSLLLAQKRLAEEEIKAYRAELRYYDAHSEVLATQREEARLMVAEAKARVEPGRQLVATRRQAEVERQKEQARKELSASLEVIRNLAQENTDLAKEQEDLASRIAAVQKQSGRTQQVKEQIGNDLTYLKENIARQELSGLIGPLMRKKRAELQNLRVYERESRATKREFPRVQMQLAEIEEKRLAVADLETEIADKVAAALEEDPSVWKADIEPRIRELRVIYQNQLAALKRDYEAYWTGLLALSMAQSTVSIRIDDLTKLVQGRVLWIRSAPPIYQMRPPGNLSKLPQLAWGTSLALFESIRAHFILNIFVLLVLAGLVVARQRIRKEILAAGDKVARVASDSFRFTLLALAGTIIVAGIWPGLLAFIAWRLSIVSERSDAGIDDLTAALASGLYTTAAIWFTLALFRLICMPNGLAERHFRWDTATLKKLRTRLAWVQIPAIALVFVVAASEGYAVIAYRDTVGRVAYIAFVAVLFVFGKRLIHPSRGVIATQFRKNTNHWVFRLRYVWYACLIVVLVALAIASTIGFHYTAIEFTEELGVTVWFALAILLLHALLARWVFVHQRRMALEEARKKRAAITAKDGDSGMEVAALEDKAIDVANISEQTLTLLRSVALFGLVVGLWVIWSDLLPALKFLNDIPLWNVTLANLLIAFVTIALTVIMAKNLPGLLEIAVLRHFQLDAGARFAVAAVTRYLITIIGLITAFNMVGIGWSKVQWLVAAMTVGLGFGLQEIFANFVSGLMLLFERPMRIGDTVTVSDVSGTVSKIRIRATTITGWDRKELVIPNKEFITGQFVNWTLSDSILRLIVPVGIAYGSDVDLAMSILKRIADEQPTTVDDPEPRILFMGFGDSSLNVELRVYIAQIADYLRTISELHCTIDREFRKAGIEIAFPQRDLHVRSIRATLPLAHSANVALEKERQPGGTEGDEN